MCDLYIVVGMMAVSQNNRFPVMSAAQQMPGMVQPSPLQKFHFQ